MIEILAEAFSQLRPNEGMTYNAGLPIDVSKIKYDNESTVRITKDELNTKIAELQAAEPMRLLRQQRDRLVSETDWWVLPDRTATQAQLDYRQALRDLPANSSPVLDENGQLINVNWPEKPE